MILVWFKYKGNEKVRVWVWFLCNWYNQIDSEHNLLSGVSYMI